MKILECIFDLSSGGAERFVVDLSNELSKTEEVILMTLKDDKIDPQHRRFYLDDISPNVRYINLGLPDGISINSWYKIYTAICIEKPEVLHIHLAPIVNYLFPTLYLLRNKSTIVQTIHTDFNLGHNNLIYKLIFSSLGKKHKMRWVAISGPNYNDLISAHPDIKGCCIYNSRGPLLVSNNFSNIKKEIDKYRRDSNTVIFIHVARCIEVKNQLMLVKAFSSYVSKGGNAQLIIIGNGFDSELGKKIESFACQAIHFLGAKKNIADYLLCSDCFCLSSLYEGLPISVIEAIRSGLPILTTPLAGVIDMVRDGFNAIVSDDFSEMSYEKSIAKVVQKIYILKVNANREKLNDKYTMSSCSKSYIDFFKQNA